MDIYFGIGTGVFLYCAKIILFHLFTTMPIFGGLFKWLHSTKYGLASIDILLGYTIVHVLGPGSVFGMIALSSFSISSVLYICTVLAIRKFKARYKFSRPSRSPVYYGRADDLPMTQETGSGVYKYAG